MRKTLLTIALILAPFYLSQALEPSKKITQYVNDVWENLLPLEAGATKS